MELPAVTTIPCRYSISAESTWLEAAWKDRTLLNKEAHHRDVMSFFSVLFFQAASGLACYVGKHKLNFRNRELLEER